MHHAVRAEPQLQLGRATYDLKSIVAHEGRKACQGHYVAFVQHEERWTLCDDAHTRPALPSEIGSFVRPGSSDKVYIAVYQQRV